jgi:ParB-like chromosome segregation protein Spo0J
MNVHPLAAMFPMLPDDELNALAESIKEHGQRHPILIGETATEDGELVEVIVDGRNRFEACRRAGVEPKFERLNGVDVRQVILAENVERRHMTKGARAMAVAMLYPQAERGRGKKDPAKNAQKVGLFGNELLRQARTVLDHSKPLAESVLAGVKPLDLAYQEAARAKQAADSEAARLDRLREQAPDLADLVTEERFSLNEALAAAEQRRIEELDRQRAATSNLSRLYSSLHPRTASPSDYAEMMFSGINPKFWPTEGEALSPDGLKRCAAVLLATAEMLEKGSSQ